MSDESQFGVKQNQDPVIPLSDTESGEQPPSAENIENKKYLTLPEYILNVLVVGADGLKGALSVWGGMVNTMFLKLSPKAYVNLANVSTGLSVFVQFYNLFAARVSDKMTNHKRTVYALYAPAAVLGILGSVPIAFMYPGITDNAKIAYICTLGILSAIISPYLGNAQNVLGIRMTPSSRERGILGTLNNTIGSAAGSLTAPVMSLIILLFSGVNPYGNSSNPNSANAYYYFYGTILFTCISMSLSMIFNRVRQVRIPAPLDPSETPSNLWGVTKAILKNRPLVLKRVSGMLGGWSGIGGSAFSLLVTKYYQGIELNLFGSHYKPSLGMLFFMFSLTQTVPSVISLSLTPFLRKRFSDKALNIFQMSWYLAGSLVSLFGLSGIFFDVPRLRKYWIQMFCYHWNGWAFGLNVCGGVMDLELLDYSEWQTGERNECTFGYLTGLFNWIFTLPTGIVGARLLIKTGYRTDRPEAPITPLVTKNLFRLFTIAPLFGQILTLIPMLFYDFSGEKRKRVMEELQVRREIQQNAKKASAESSVEDANV